MKNMIVIVVLLLAGCAAQGAASTPSASASSPFEAGKTTLKEVERVLGEPNRSKPDAGGGTLACYQYMGNSEPEMFIRIVGGGVERPDLTCCYGFASNGVLDGATAEGGSDARSTSCPPPYQATGSPLHLQPVSGAAKPVE